MNAAPGLRANAPQTRTPSLDYNPPPAQAEYHPDEC